MPETHVRIVALSSCLLSLVAGCASAAQEPVGEASAALVDAFQWFEDPGVATGGKGSTTIEPGMLWTWEPAVDGTAKGEIVTECDGPLCRLVSADATLISSSNTLDGPTSVWQLSIVGSDEQLWTGQLVTREPPQDPQGPQEDINLNFAKVVWTYGSRSDAPTPSPSWSSMARASAVVCITPDCAVEFLEGGWTCMPICTLSTLGK